MKRVDSGIQSYKKSSMNTIDSLILANIALISMLLDKYSGQDNGNHGLQYNLPISWQLHGNCTNGSDDWICKLQDYQEIN